MKKPFQKYPLSPSDLQQKFGHFVTAGGISEGISYFQDLVSRRPEYGLAWRLLGRLQETAGNDERAYYAFYQAATCNHVVGVPSAYQTADFLTVARFCMRRGWLDRAKRHLSEISLLDPKNTEAKALNEQIKVRESTLPEVHIGHASDEAVASRGNSPVKSQFPPREGVHAGRLDEAPTASRMALAHNDFIHGNFEKARALYADVIQEHPRFASAHVSLARCYEKLGNLSSMENSLTTALKARVDNEAAVLDALGTLYIKQNRYREVVHIYEKLLGQTKVESKMVGAYQWLGKAHRELGELQLAKDAYISALRLAPTNGYIRTRLSQLERTLAEQGSGNSSDLTTYPADPEYDDDLPEWGDDDEVPKVGISPMLEADATRHRWNDEEIIKRGGVVRAEDARRFMERAMSAQQEFAPKAAMFLEAAKAFGVLDETDRDANLHQQALQRYASQQGGRYLLELLGELKQHPHPRTDRSRWLRDSACAYYVEAMKILQQQDKKFMHFILQKYSQAILVSEMTDPDTDKVASMSFSQILEAACKSPQANVLRQIVQGLMELGRAQMNLVREAYDSPGIRRIIQRNRPRWRECLNHFHAPEDKGIPSAMRSTIQVWQQSEYSAREKFSEVFNYPATLENIADIRIGLTDLKQMIGVFSESDLELLSRIIDEVLPQLISYGQLPSAGSAERDLVAQRVTKWVRHLRDHIDSYPTYWGRVMFDALLLKWERLLGRAERERLAEIRPDIEIQLESTLLSAKENVTIVFSVTNIGQATATEAALILETDRSITEKAEYSVQIGNIQPGTNLPAQVPITISASPLPSFLSIRYRLLYRFADKEQSLPIAEKTVHFGVFKRIKHNPYNESDRVENPDMFKGREDLLTWLTTKLQSSDRVRSTLLYGLSRMGKTSALIQLRRRILLQPVALNDDLDSFRFLPLLVPFDGCASVDSAPAFYSAVFTLIACEIEELRMKHGASDLPQLPTESYPTDITGLELLVRDVIKHKLYPVFLIDEFSLYRQLFGKRILDATFLSRLRRFSLDERVASFIYSGTYDLKALSSDPAYGITGQFATTDERQVGTISDDAARDLISVIDNQLHFSNAAVDHLLFLSGRIPHYVQMICKNCVYYANQCEAPTITLVELDAVVRSLIVNGSTGGRGASAIQPLSAATFQPLWRASDPPLMTALIGMLAFGPHAGRADWYFTFDQLKTAFRNHKVAASERDLFECLEDLVSKQIVTKRSLSLSSDAEYQLAVDLFRRWFVENYSMAYCVGRMRNEVQDEYSKSI